MKAEHGSLVGNYLSPLASPESSGRGLAAQKHPTGNFTEHLHSAETKRQQGKSPSRARAAVQVGSAKEGSKSSLAANISSAKGARPSKQTDSFPPARPPNFAHRINTQPDAQPKVEAQMATGISDSTEAAAPAEVDGEESLPDSAAPKAESADQVMPATPLILFAPPVIHQPVIPLPTTPLTGAGEVTLATTGSAEVSSEQPSEALAPPASTRREVTDETGSSASALNLEGQVGPDEQMEPLAGDSGAPGQGESQQREDRSHLDFLAHLSAGSDEPVDGTSAAKQQLPMKNAVEMEESAGPAVKNLPGTESALEVPAARVISRVEETHAVRHDLQVNAAASHFSATTTLSSGTTTAANSAESASDAPAVERVARAVMEGVVQMRHTGTESVSVVLKADGGTELLLRVEMRDGALSAQLHFERGDRGGLDQHWDELQRRLAEQGVRLTRTEDAGLGGNAQFEQSQQRPPVPEEDSMANASSTFTQKSSNNQTVNRRSARGFETWA